jgi:hypothetical protein
MELKKFEENMADIDRLVYFIDAMKFHFQNKTFMTAEEVFVGINFLNMTYESLIGEGQTEYKNLDAPGNDGADMGAF